MVEVSEHNWSRRKFLKVSGGAAFLSGLFPFAEAENARTKITDIQTMTLSRSEERRVGKECVP